MLHEGAHEPPWVCQNRLHRRLPGIRGRASNDDDEPDVSCGGRYRGHVHRHRMPRSRREAVDGEGRASSSPNLRRRRPRHRSCTPGAGFHPPRKRALETLAAEGYGRERVEVRHCADLGYLRQNSELAIPLQATLLTPRHLQQLAEDCSAKHEQTYGDHSPQETVQIVNIRVVARGLDLALSHRRPDVVGEGADVRWVICVLAGDQPLVVAPTGSPDVPFALLPQVVDVHA
jgi:hypothetical protein